MGPIHYVMVAFDQPDFHGRLAQELAVLVDAGAVRLLDLVFVSRAADGAVSILEVDALPVDADAYDDVEGEFGGLVSDADLDQVADLLEPDTAGALLVWENTWAERFVSALAETGGVVVDEGFVPVETMETALMRRRARMGQQEQEAGAYEAQAMAAATPPPPVSPTTGAPSLIDQLRELGQLRDDGVLTAEEFAVQKARLLNA
ncbi:hypothetical protein ASE25_09450 [Terrabacter sp. Root85]|uniref:SHOCT domain-containing protein n=1 Tax=Terrabacter sp. Root85 TaxID=1736603 RepID=UPI000700037D|nr:SHOCT domain-containing protein [Terrabacter sp. Root85]KRC89761.1 hypothetical protein ASE25_09450 [Terrabacter sp. Root85]